MDPDLKREIIMNNYLNPFNREIVNNPDYIKVNGNNESCIDNINIYILIENDLIKDLKFDGEACAISTAATSIMLKMLIGKTTKEVLDIANEYDNMINEKDYNQDLLAEANCFDEIYKQQNRKNCALLPWKALKKVFLNNKEQ